MKILAINGSPQKRGNTALLLDWVADGARAAGGEISMVSAAGMKTMANGCIACRQCQKQSAYGCVLPDAISDVLQQMVASDVIVLATPLYFFAASAQIKAVVDRMFALYHWDNAANTMQTVLQGKTLALLASAYEAVGLDALERPFVLTAEYTGMHYASLLIADAGESGEIVRCAGAREKAAAFGQYLAAGKHGMGHAIR
jgi:multimeric flavodoxin WrbA